MRQRIDDADSDTPVAVDQCTANFIDEAVRLVSAMQTFCLSSYVDITIRGHLSVLLAL